MTTVVEGARYYCVASTVGVLKACLLEIIYVKGVVISKTQSKFHIQVLDFHLDICGVFVCFYATSIAIDT